MTEHIVDVRKGQNSDGFDRYPYDEMKKQSLSVLFEGEKRSKLIKIMIMCVHWYFGICLIMFTSLILMLCTCLYA